MNWGYKIFFSFIIFIGIIITMVVISMKQDISLVSEDYYNQEIAYQDQIDRIRRTSELEVQPVIEYNRQNGIVTIDVNASNLDEGNVLFFRPSDSAKDRQILFPENSNGRLVVPVAGWDGGLWKVKIHWTQAGADYYAEEVINL